MGIKQDYQIITKDIFNLVCDLYLKWKELNAGIKMINSRGVNFPDTLSEIMVCYALKWKRNYGASGDATDERGRLVEIKASSRYDDDLSSFSPKTKFERLFFLRVNQDRDEAEIYDMEMDFSAFEKLNVNKHQSVKDQQVSKRRPRLSLIDLIGEKKLQPSHKVVILEKRVIEL